MSIGELDGGTAESHGENPPAASCIFNFAVANFILASELELMAATSSEKWC